MKTFLSLLVSITFCCCSAAAGRYWYQWWIITQYYVKWKPMISSTFSILTKVFWWLCPLPSWGAQPLGRDHISSPVIVLLGDNASNRNDYDSGVGTSQMGSPVRPFLIGHRPHDLHSSFDLYTRIWVHWYFYGNQHVGYIAMGQDFNEGNQFIKLWSN